jgi:hypothetical protein
MTIEIFDKSQRASGNFLEVGLLDILDVLEPEGSRMHWSILDLEARTSPNSGIHMLDLEAGVSNFGKYVTLAELRELASKLSQVINGVFCGCEGKQCAPQDLTDDELRKRCDVAMAVAMSKWLCRAFRAGR